MDRIDRDRGLEDLLALDGVTLVVDPLTSHWVKFKVTRVPKSPARPHGVNYSLTLHAPDGERLAGFDNAHAIAEGSGPARRRLMAHDHRHRGAATTPYLYRDSATLIADFWAVVDAILKERGVLS